MSRHARLRSLRAAPRRGHRGGLARPGRRREGFLEPLARRAVPLLGDAHAVARASVASDAGAAGARYPSPRASRFRREARAGGERARFEPASLIAAEGDPGEARPRARRNAARGELGVGAAGLGVSGAGAPETPEGRAFSGASTRSSATVSGSATSRFSSADTSAWTRGAGFAAECAVANRGNAGRVREIGVAAPLAHADDPFALAAADLAARTTIRSISRTASSAKGAPACAAARCLSRSAPSAWRAGVANGGADDTTLPIQSPSASRSESSGDWHGDASAGARSSRVRGAVSGARPARPRTARGARPGDRVGRGRGRETRDREGRRSFRRTVRRARDVRPGGPGGPASPAAAAAAMPRAILQVARRLARDVARGIVAARVTRGERARDRHRERARRQRGQE